MGFRLSRTKDNEVGPDFGDDLTIRYALPVSAVRVSATVTFTTDELVDDGTTQRTVEAAATLEVVAGPRNQTIIADAGRFAAAKASFALTEDGRLTSASARSEGGAGKLLLGAAKLGAVGAALAVGGAPGAMLAAGAVAAAGADEDREAEPADPILDAYRREHPEEWELRARYTEVLKSAVHGIADATEEWSGAEGEDRKPALERMRTQRKIAAVARSELEWLDRHFEAWRATKVSVRTETHEQLLELEALAGITVDNGGVNFGERGTKARKVWEDFDILVTVSEAQRSAPEGEKRTNQALVRVPRRATVSVYERQGEQAVLRESRSALVLDDACETWTIELPKRALGDAEVNLNFAASGAWTGISTASTSGAAALADTLGQLPETIGGAVTTAKSFHTELAGLRSLGSEQRLAQLERELKVRQTELAKAGLLATEGSFVELEKLKREADLIAQRKAIAPTVADPIDAEIASLRQQVQLLRLRSSLDELDS